MPIKCKIFSSEHTGELTTAINNFLEEKKIESSNIFQIIQTQSEASKYSPNIVISIFYIEN